MSTQKTQDFMDIGDKALSVKEADVLIKKIRDAIDLADQSGYHSGGRIDVSLSFAKRGEWVPGPRPNWHYSVQAVQLRFFGSLLRRFIKRSVKVVNGKIDLQNLKKRRDELKALQSIENNQVALEHKVAELKSKAQQAGLEVEGTSCWAVGSGGFYCLAFRDQPLTLD